jgi:site-specific DNA recombinase
MSGLRNVPAAMAAAAEAAAASAEPGQETIRVARYRRASTDEANQPYSLDAQDLRLVPYIASHPGWVEAGDYVERASAKDVIGRPQLQKLLHDAVAGKFDLVLVARIDRWSRNQADLLDTVSFLEKHGIAFHSATEHFDTTSPMGKMSLSMLGMFAEFERSMIIDRIIRGNAAKISRGIPLSGRVGFGLRVNEKGRIELDPATSGTVTRIFTEYVSGQKGTKAVGIGLNESGLPGPIGRRWTADSVSRVLRNRSFVGEIWHRDRWYAGAHDALVDETLFAEAQTILDARAEPSRAARGRGDFVLSGRIICARCRGAYVGTSGTARNGSLKRYYSCGTARRRGATSCDGPNLPAQELEALLTDALLRSYADTALFSQAIAAHIAAHARRQEPLTEQLTAVRAAVSAKKRVRAKYQDDYEANRLTAERYEARAAQLDQELAALFAHVAKLELQTDVTQLPALPSKAELLALRARLGVGVRAGSLPVRKALFEALVESIEVHDTDDIRPTFRLYDPSAAGRLDTDLTHSAAGQTPDMAGDGSRFASHRLGWS